MNTPQEHHEQPDRSEGLGTRVRRFVDSEVNRLLEKKDRGKDGRESHEGRTGYASDPDLADPGDGAGAPERSRPPEPGPARGADPAGSSEPVEIPTGGQAGSAQRVGLLSDVVGLRDEWQRVQGTFVDNPQRAVQEASVLVDRTLEEIRVNVASGYDSETLSTEELRVSFQRYREFFHRLLSA